MASGSTSTGGDARSETASAGTSSTQSSSASSKVSAEQPRSETASQEDTSGTDQDTSESGVSTGPSTRDSSQARTSEQSGSRPPPPDDDLPIQGLQIGDSSSDQVSSISSTGMNTDLLGRGRSGTVLPRQASSSSMDVDRNPPAPPNALLPPITDAQLTRPDGPHVQHHSSESQARKARIRDPQEMPFSRAPSADINLTPRSQAPDDFGGTDQPMDVDDQEMSLPGQKGKETRTPPVSRLVSVCPFVADGSI